MNRYSIPAFTLVEAIVTLVVSAIIMSIVFVIFTITSERLMDFKKQNEHINDLNRISYLMQKAMAESEDVKIEGNEILFSFYSGKTYTLKIHEDKITGFYEILQDTFKIEVTRMTFDTLSSPKKDNIYNRLKWETKINGQEIPLAFYKKIYPNQLLKKSVNQ